MISLFFTTFQDLSIIGRGKDMQPYNYQGTEVCPSDLASSPAVPRDPSPGRRGPRGLPGACGDHPPGARPGLTQAGEEEARRFRWCEWCFGAVQAAPEVL